MNWRDELDDSIKADPSLANFKDIGQLAKSFIDMKSYQGQSIHIPSDDAGDDAHAKFAAKLIEKAPNIMMRPDFDNEDQSKEFWATMGKPEESSMYEIPEIEYPEGMNANEDKISSLKSLAHELNLNKKQFSTLLTKLTEQDIAAENETKQTNKENMESLNKEWGAATKDRIEASLSIAERTKAPTEIIDMIKGNTLPPETMKWMHSLSVSLGNEGNQLGDLPYSNNSDRMTPAEAQEKIDEIYANKDHAFYKGNKAAMEKMIELVGFVSPKSSRDINDLRAG